MATKSTNLRSRFFIMWRVHKHRVDKLIYQTVVPHFSQDMYSELCRSLKDPFFWIWRGIHIPLHNQISEEFHDGRMKTDG